MFSNHSWDVLAQLGKLTLGSTKVISVDDRDIPAQQSCRLAEFPLAGVQNDFAKCLQRSSKCMSGDTEEK